MTRPVIPVADVIPCRTRPVATLTIMGLTAAVFVWQLTLRPDAAAAVRAQYGFTPASSGLWTVLSSLLLHAGWLHLATTLAPLWLFGRSVEDRLGAVRFVALYLLGAATGAAALTWASPSLASPVIGAGAAAGAVTGAYLVLFPYSRVLVLVPTRHGLDAAEIPAGLVMLFWAVFTMGSGLGTDGPGPVPVLTFWLVLGGVVAGLAAGRVLRRRERMAVAWWSPRPGT